MNKKQNIEERNENEESCLIKIPFLGYILRKIKKNREAIDETLKTEKEIEGEVKERRLLGIIRIVSGKTFQPLNLKEKKRKWLKRRK